MVINKYKSAIANELKVRKEQVFLYWKGRVALFAALKAMSIKEGDEIIIPAFTCVVVPNAILYLKAKPVYVDISPENYNVDVNKIEKVITAKTKVIICQNTFGLSSNIEKIVDIAKQYNLYTIEDCTHGFGGTYNGKPNGSYCDAAFYSTQWNKPFSTGIGGFLVVNNESLINPVHNLEQNKIKPSIFDQIVLYLLIYFNKYFINDFTYWPMVKLFRFLSEKNLIIGSNQGEELKSIVMPENYFKDISSVQVKTGLKQLKNIEQINNLRKNNAKYYTLFLKEKKKIYVDESLFDNHIFLRYPILVKDREKFLAIAEKEKIKLGDWFLSPIHPIEKDLDLWGIVRENYPYADKLSQKIVNLPTEVKDNKNVLKFLNVYIKMIE